MPTNMLGKERNAGVVILLAIVTLGIYGIVWGYSVFQELHDYRGRGWSGAMYLIFTLVPILSLAGIAVPWLLPAYVGHAFEESGMRRPITGLSGFWIFIPLIGGIVWLIVVQGKMNQLWRELRANPAPSAA